MRREDVSVTAMHPFILEFTKAILGFVSGKGYSYEEKQVIHADMVPKFSEKVAMAHLRERVHPVQVVLPAKPVPKPVVVPKPEGLVRMGEGFSIIVPLLRDPTISSIECRGAEKPLGIVRFGQKQLTRIALSKEQIDDVLKHVSDEVHIPVMEGVFRAIGDGYSISAVVSGVIGTKFVIRKSTPYNLLEGMG